LVYEKYVQSAGKLVAWATEIRKRQKLIPLEFTDFLARPMPV